ncbi:MAG: primosomal protein N' [Oscillospiraceae bacterium]|nr:primosomal protein N' [Oscillospiraceae bacterium]
MPERKIARVAVSGVTYWVDRPFDYLVPPELVDRAAPGVRVFVPFGRGNRRTEGLILAVQAESSRTELKAVLDVLDEEPIVSEAQIRLLIWLRERCFCTIYDGLKAMLPTGLWFDSKGACRVGDKTVRLVSLAIPAEEAILISAQKRRSAPVQSNLLRILCETGRVSVPELCAFSGAKTQSVNALEKAGLVKTEEITVFRRPSYREREATPLPELNAEQQNAYDGLREKLESGKPEAALLFGVTGSGKTAVYVHLISHALSMGKTAIMLVPEIALTPQMLETFSGYFGDKTAVLHSSLSVGERRDEWMRIKCGEARVVIGTRSAVFAPVENLGILIMDEEQEDSYRSENNPRFHTRNVAKYLCAHNNALMLLGSATPDISSMYAAQEGRYSFYRLDKRYNQMQLPSVKFVDMKRELRAGNGTSLSGELLDALRQRIESGEQSILFLNRRGTNKLINCGECGYVYECPRCSVSLTWHSANRRLICHYCGYSQKISEDICPDCGGKLNYIGTGTQKVEEELRELLPGVEILRMDADSVGAAGSHEAILSRFREEKIPILLGTQMVAKGLDFENVTLVGVISADQSLYSGDFRAAERTFSLLTQVIGRSGRGEKPGEAIIQTYTPENRVIRLAAEQDYEGFYSAELEVRRMQSAPPFCSLYRFTASGMDEAQVLRCCTEIRQQLREVLRDREDVQILGPAPLPVLRVNNRYRYSVTLACKDDRYIRGWVAQTVIQSNTNRAFRGVSVYADCEI